MPFAAFALGEQVLVLGIAGEDAKTLHGVEIVLFPITRKRREIVCADDGQGVFRIFFRQQIARAVMVEVHHAVGIDTVFTKSDAHFVRHDTEVFADDDAAGAATFEGKDGHQFSQRVAHVSTEIGAVAVGNPP